MSADAGVITINVQRTKNGKRIIHSDGKDLSEEQLYTAIKVGDQLEKADEFYRKKNIDKALAYYKLAAKAGDLKAQLKVVEILEKYILNKENTIKTREKNPLQEFVDNLARASYQKHKESQLRLGLVYFRGDFGYIKDINAAYKWFEEAAIDGTLSDAIYYKGYCLLKGLGVKTNIAEAIDCLKLAQSKNNLDAIFQLADCYEHGVGVTKDPKQAFLLFQEALKIAQDDKNVDSTKLERAKANVARCHARGIGTKKDEKAAVEQANQMTSDNFPGIQYAIGNLNKIISTNEESDAKAFARYQAAADQDHMMSMIKVADAYLEGKGVEKDLKKSMEYLEKAAKKDDPIALLRCGKNYLLGFGVKKDHRLAIKYFKRAYQELHHEPAMYYLGLCYVLFGTKEEHSLGFNLLTSAANLGDENAKSRLGWCYMLGRGVGKDIRKAIEIFETLLSKNTNNTDINVMFASALLFAKGGVRDRERGFQLLKQAEDLQQKRGLKNPEIYQMLARCHHFGYGVAKDSVKAIEYLNQSIALGNQTSNVMLALCHFNGSGVPKNTDLAIKILKDMINANCTEAVNCWGIFVLMGWGNEKANPKKAFNLFKHAIMLDILHCENDSYNNLGWCYLQGLGTEQNYGMAVKYFEEARTRGNRCAINNLAWCYMNGFGVPRDMNQAKRLFLEAQNFHHEPDLANGFGMSYLGYWSLENEIHRLDETKDPDILFNLAFCYLNGLGVVQNIKKGLEIITTLAKDLKYPKAMLELGNCYLNGIGGEKNKANDKMAFELFCQVANSTCLSSSAKKEQQAALDSDDEDETTSKTSEIETAKFFNIKIEAYLQLAICAMVGRGTAKNPKRGFELIKSCSDMGYPKAQFYLGLLLYQGKSPENPGVIDKKRAFECFKMAVDKGYAPALPYVALFLEQGGDFKQAFEYYQLAVEQGEAVAENNLGILYEKGEGVIQDLGLAFQYYERSARCGDYDLGWYHLGRCYELGIGTVRNLSAAIQCYERAALQGFAPAERILFEREGLRSPLSSERGEQTILKSNDPCREESLDSQSRVLQLNAQESKAAMDQPSPKSFNLQDCLFSSKASMKKGTDPAVKPRAWADYSDDEALDQEQELKEADEQAVQEIEEQVVQKTEKQAVQETEEQPVQEMDEESLSSPTKPLFQVPNHQNGMKTKVKRAIVMCSPLDEIIQREQAEQEMQKLSFMLDIPFLNKDKPKEDTVDAGTIIPSFLPLNGMQKGTEQRQKASLQSHPTQLLMLNGHRINNVDLKTAFHKKNNLTFLR